jgi:hypothetical protein
MLRGADFMCQSGNGRGVLLPSRKHSPAIGVKYEITHFIAEMKESNGMPVRQNRAAVRSLSDDKGQPIPLGDFDLIINDEIIRLKHVDDDPEWLVLSSQA